MHRDALESAISTALFLCLMAAPSVGDAVIPVQSQVETLATAMICTAATCETVLFEEVALPSQTQGTFLGPLAVTADATGQAGTCSVSITSAVSASWASATSGSVSASRSGYIDGGGAAVLGSWANAPGWSYSFTPEGNGTFNVSFSASNSIAWAVDLYVDEIGQARQPGGGFSVPISAGVTTTVRLELRGGAVGGACVPPSGWPFNQSILLDWSITEGPAPSVPASSNGAIATLAACLAFAATAAIRRRRAGAR